MRVLVIGGTRFVGYFLTWRLLARGDEVTLLNRGTPGDPFGDRVERIRCDRTAPQFEDVLADRVWDACVDFAAYEGIDVERAVRCLRNRVGHYVFISTGQVYLVREGCRLPAVETDYEGPVIARPDDPENVGSWEYGIGKRAGEDVLEAAWREHRFPSTRVRIPMVNGERDHFRRIESYLWRILDGGPLLVPDGGRNVCRHVYGREVARGVADLLGRTETHGRAYNLSQEEQIPLFELLHMLAGMLGSRANIHPVSRQQLAVAGLDAREVSPFSGRWMSNLDPSRAREELGFRHLPLATYVEAIVAHFLASPPDDRPAGYVSRKAEVGLVS